MPRADGSTTRSRRPTRKPASCSSVSISTASRTARRGRTARHGAPRARAGARSVRLPVPPRRRIVPIMGFLDKLFGRTKDTADDAVDKAEPMPEKAQDAAGDAWDKASDAADDMKDEAADA